MRILLASFLLIGIFSVAHSDQSDFIDNGIFTTVSSTGLDWLDLTETSGRSYYDVYFDLLDISATETGIRSLALNDTFNVSDRWRFATTAEFSQLVINWAGDAPYYFQSGIPPAPRENTFDRIDYAAGTFDGLIGLLNGGQGYLSNSRCAVIGSSFTSTVDFSSQCADNAFQLLSSFLVRTTAVPEASSLYLLAFGLFGLFGATRRKV